MKLDLSLKPRKKKDRRSAQARASVRPVQPARILKETYVQPGLNGELIEVEPNLENPALDLIPTAPAALFEDCNCFVDQICIGASETAVTEKAKPNAHSETISTSVLFEDCNCFMDTTATETAKPNAHSETISTSVAGTIDKLKNKLTNKEEKPVEPTDKVANIVSVGSGGAAVGEETLNGGTVSNIASYGFGFTDIGMWWSRPSAKEVTKVIGPSVDKTHDTTSSTGISIEGDTTVDFQAAVGEETWLLGQTVSGSESLNGVATSASVNSNEATLLKWWTSVPSVKEQSSKSSEEEETKSNAHTVESEVTYDTRTSVNSSKWWFEEMGEEIAHLAKIKAVLTARAMREAAMAMDQFAGVKGSDGSTVVTKDYTVGSYSTGDDDDDSTFITKATREPNESRDDDASFADTLVTKDYTVGSYFSSADNSTLITKSTKDRHEGRDDYTSFDNKSTHQNEPTLVSKGNTARSHSTDESTVKTRADKSTTINDFLDDASYFTYYTANGKASRCML
jgi:hypothetical protein